MTSRTETLLFDKRYSWLLHVAFWVFVYLDFLIDFEYLANNWDSLLIDLVVTMIVVYFNLYYLLPKFLLNKKYEMYVFTSLLCQIVLIIANHFIQEPFLEDVTTWQKTIDFIEDFIYNGFILGSAIGLKLFKALLKNRIQLDELKTLSNESELNNLKNQINPHFLFNTMNSMYVMAQKGDERLPDMILDLSDLMRFQLHQGSKPSIGIGEEFKFIKNYIKFEQLRRSDLTINFHEEINDPSIPIPPLIFLCFIENAMKHSKSMDNTANTVEISIVTGDNIHFEIKNKIGDFQAKLDDPDKGIGQANVMKRLNLIYGNQYHLNIEEDGINYHVKLTLPTKLEL